MINKCYAPCSLEEAIGTLSSIEERTRVIAGGTDLVIQLQNREVHLDSVVDISGIEELSYICDDHGKISIGAAITHTELAESRTIGIHAPLLAEAARSIGSRQIRNVGTIGGNIVNGQPAADTAIALLALDAEITIVSTEGERTIPLNKLYRPGGGVALDPSREILKEITFDSLLEKGGVGAFGRLARRKSLALPVFNCGVVLWFDQVDFSVRRAAISMGPVGRAPFRANEAEAILTGAVPGEETFKRAAAAAADEARPRDSLFRGSAGYRKHVAAVIVFRSLKNAWNIINGRCED